MEENKNLLIELNGLLRIYRYKKWKSPKIELLIYNAPFSNKLLKLNKVGGDYRAVVEFKEDLILVKKNKLGNRFCPRTVNQFCTLALAKIVGLEKKQELSSLLVENKQYYSKKVRVKINPCEWGLEYYEFFTESLEENELVREISKKFPVKNITANSLNSKKYGNGDIVVEINCKEIPIELTANMPSVQKKEISKGGNAPHGVKWGKVAGKILTLFLYTVETGNPSIIVIHKSWEKYKHTKDLQGKLEKRNCFIIYTSFKDNWAKIITDNLEKMLSEKACCVLG